MFRGGTRARVPPRLSFWTMTGWQLLTSTWNWDPSVLVGSAALVGVYLAAVRSRLTTRALVFVAGVLVTLLALVSPLDVLGDTYLFSAHMVQHLLLMQVAPPLLLLGTPAWLAKKITDWPVAGRAERIVGRPWVAWLLGIGTMWVWHLPALYNATLADEGLHIVEHVSFLVTSTIFWWPVLSPLTERRLSPPATFLYLVPAIIAGCMLGSLVSYAAPGVYNYLHPADTLDALPLLRGTWGISPAVDQLLGGLAMWVLGGLVYLYGILDGIARWHKAPFQISR
jgi:cytochrome c oxidase assembly factor CtaG